MKTEILIAEHRPLLQLGIQTAIARSGDLRVAGTAADVRHASRLIERQRPGICLTAFDLPDTGGLALLASVIAGGLPTRVVMLGQPCRGRQVVQAITQGAAGFLDARISAPRLCELLRQAATGRQVLSDEAQRALLRRLRQSARYTPQAQTSVLLPDATLTERELQVLQCAAEGLSIVDTARRLHMSEATVKNHRQHIFARLGVSNVPAAIYRAVHAGLLR